VPSQRGLRDLLARAGLNWLARAQRYWDCEAADKGFPIPGWQYQIRLALRTFILSQAVLAIETN
jgi:hypothetical protein